MITYEKQFRSLPKLYIKDRDSNLAALFKSTVPSIDNLFSDIDTVAQETVLNTADSTFLDNAGLSYGVQRFLDENDALYSSRVCAESFLPKSTIQGIEAILSLFVPGDIAIYEWYASSYSLLITYLASHLFSAYDTDLNDVTSSINLSASSGTPCDFYIVTSGSNLSAGAPGFFINFSFLNNGNEHLGPFGNSQGYGGFLIPDDAISVFSQSASNKRLVQILKRIKAAGTRPILIVTE